MEINISDVGNNFIALCSHVVLKASIDDSAIAPGWKIFFVAGPFSRIAQQSHNDNSTLKPLGHNN